MIAQYSLRGVTDWFDRLLVRRRRRTNFTVPIFFARVLCQV